MYLLYTEFLNLSKFFSELVTYIQNYWYIGGLIYTMDELIKNLMNTPENTNPNVLRGQLQKIAGSDGVSSYDELNNKPISIKESATYTYADGTTDGSMQGVAFKRVSDFMSAQDLNGATITINGEDIVLSEDLMDDIASEAASMGYTGESFIMVGEDYLMSLDSTFELQEAQITFSEPGVYIPEGATLTIPDKVETSEEFAPYFLPQISSADDGKLLVAKDKVWTPTKKIFSSMGIYSYENIKRILANGDGATMFPLWSQICVPHKEFGDIVFDVVNYDSTTKALTLWMHDCVVPQYEFDAPEPTNPDSNRQSYGSNNYGQSAARQWLNGTGNDWWNAKTEYDVEPSYAAKPGFLTGFPEEFVEVLEATQRVCATNTVVENGSVDGTTITTNSSYTVTDKMFLPSFTELTGENNNNVAEGTQFGALSKAGVTSSSNYTILKKRNTKTGEYYWYWERSCYPDISNVVRDVLGDGNPRHSGYAGSRDYGFAAACVIKG